MNVIKNIKWVSHWRLYLYISNTEAEFTSYKTVQKSKYVWTRAGSTPDQIGCPANFSLHLWFHPMGLHDFLLQEVTLRKCSSDEKLGLTVCYSSGSEADTCTEVYIRDIAPQSVADRDGRLRQGDQILQVVWIDFCLRFSSGLLLFSMRLQALSQ